MRGAKPKPTHLKLVTGNPGKRKLNKNEPKPTPQLPMPPEDLCDDAKVEWGRVSEELFRLDLLTKLDRSALAAYCQAYGRWMQAERLLGGARKKSPANGGLLIRTTNGNYVQSPLVGIANKAMADMVRYAAEFGMTPSARSRIQTNPKDEEDPADEFLAR